MDAGALLRERSRFNSEVAPALAGYVRTDCVPAALGASSRFAWFDSDDALIVVAGSQEAGECDRALAYGTKLRGHRRLALILPRSHALATQQRLPFLKTKAEHEVWLHDVTVGAGADDPERVPVRSQQEAIDAVLAKVSPGMDTAADLSRDMNGIHLGPRSEAIAPLVEWAATHPTLMPGHRRGERAWQCLGQKVLTIRPSQGRGVTIRAGIHYTSAGNQPVALQLGARDTLTDAQLRSVQDMVRRGIAERLDDTGAHHQPDEHWLQAVIRDDPRLVGVEQPALREVPAWRPGGRHDGWGRGFIDLVGLDGAGDIRLVETKLAKNKDEMLIFQGVDYYVWARAYQQALRARLGAAPTAQFVVHYVIGATPGTNDHTLSTYTPAQAEALDIPWRFQVITGWFTTPQRKSPAPASSAYPAGELP